MIYFTNSSRSQWGVYYTPRIPSLRRTLMGQEYWIWGPGPGYGQLIWPSKNETMLHLRLSSVEETGLTSAACSEYGSNGGTGEVLGLDIARIQPFR